MEYFVTYLSMCCVLPLVAVVQGDLSHSLHAYDTLHSRDINHHHVTRRSINGGKPVNERLVSFDTLGRHFLLHLKTNQGLFSPDFHAVEIGADKSREFVLDKDEFYQGYLDDDHSSRVLAHYEHDNLVVNIRTKTDVYYVEPSWRHLPTSDNYTMIAYRASDVKTDKKTNPSHHVGSHFCGVGAGEFNETVKIPLDEVTEDHYSYSRNHGNKGRYKRQAVNLKSCPVTLVADYTFTQAIGDSSTATTAIYLSGVLASVNAIYESTDFGNGYQGMGFAIREIQVYRTATSTPQFNAQQSYWQTDTLLKSFGKEDWSASCLSHLFTYRAFDGGVQGLGWVASSNLNEVGGICSPGYQSSYYNTAWTSNLNSRGERILTSEANLVTAHEFGHNWGSPHDPSGCAPSGHDGGKFVMYQYSVSGYDDNNDRFSSCSRSSIGSVLQAKSARCFTERTNSYCGNGNVEEGEECDAGSLGIAGEDPCCTNMCTFKSSSVCSDVNSPCCQSCQLITTPATQCQADNPNTCDAAAFCNGVDATCPTPEKKVDGDPCLDNGQCLNGACLSYCTAQNPNQISCYCETETAAACTYCCRTASTECGSTGVQMPDGHGCYAGYCVGGVCEAVTDNTIRLWDVIKAADFNAILEWMRNNIVITVIVLSIILYLPFCLAVWCIDRRRRKQDKDEVDWHNRDNNRLIRDSDNRRIHEARRRHHQPTRSGNYSRLDEEDEDPSEASPY